MMNLLLSLNLVHKLNPLVMVVMVNVYAKFSSVLLLKDPPTSIPGMAVLCVHIDPYSKDRGQKSLNWKVEIVRSAF